MSPADVAALAETVVVYDTGRIRQVLPFADADKPRVVAGLLSPCAA